MTKKEIVHVPSFRKAIEEIQPIEPDDVDQAILTIKKAYHSVCGLRSSEAAIAADKLYTMYHGAKATEQAVIATNIINIASALTNLRKQLASSKQDILNF